jgi:cytochrome c5
MKRAYFLMCLILVAVFMLPACKKKEEAPPAKTEQAAPAMQQEKEAAPPTQQPAASSGMTEMSGEEVYNKACATCHTSGVADAPKTGDMEAWKDRIAQGTDTLYDHAINGYEGMPAKGGDSSLTDDQVKAAVDYMLGQSK